MARFVAEIRAPAEALSQLSLRLGVSQREARPRPLRQFMQFDADTVGTPGVAADAEMAMMMADVMEALGVKRGDYVIRVNNRKVLEACWKRSGSAATKSRPPADGAERHRQAGQVRAGRRAPAARCRSLGWRQGRRGDFTKGAGLNDDTERGRVLRYIYWTAFRESRNDLSNGGSTSPIYIFKIFRTGEQYFFARVPCLLVFGRKGRSRDRPQVSKASRTRRVVPRSLPIGRL